MNHLPFEIQIQILGKLDGPSIKNLLMVSKSFQSLDTPALWKSLLHDRFRISSESKDQFILLDRQSRFLNAKELGIAWGDNDSYWQIGQDSSSVSGYVASVRYVWWFDIFAEFKSVLPNTYTPCLRIKVHEYFWARNVNPIIIVHIKDNQKTLELQTFRDVLKDGEFHIIQLDTITLDAVGNVTIQICDRNTSTAKARFEIDYVSLKPLL